MKINKKSGIIFLGIIPTIIILLFLLTYKKETNYDYSYISITDIENYLEKQNYNDEFSNIEFVKTGDYILRDTSWTGGASEKKLGTYIRYKVHANKANFDFYVQYLDIEPNNYFEKGFEDDYMLLKNRDTMSNGIKSIFNEKFGYNLTVKYSYTSESNELGRLDDDDIIFLNIYINEPIENICTKNYLDKVKNTSNKLATLIENTYSENDEFLTLYLYLESSEYKIGFICHLDSNNKGNVELNYTFKENNEKTNEYKSLIKNWLKDNQDIKFYINGFIPKVEV